VPKHTTFADINCAEGYLDIPVRYKNLEWTGFQCSSKIYQNQGYAAYNCNIIYTNNNSEFVSFCFGNGSISVRHLNMLFGVTSLDVSVSAPWNFHLTITGYRKSMLINTYTSTFMGPQLMHIDLRWTDIDELIFSSNCHFLLIDLVLTRAF